MYFLSVFLTISAAAITWVLISFGAAVRLYGAGLACPDWPLCYGSLTPPPTFTILLEVGHRYLASFLGLLLIVIYAICWNKKLRTCKKLAGWLLFLVIFQGIMGGLTVLLKLNFSTVVAHLLLGNLLFLGLICLSYEILFLPKTDLKKMLNPPPKFYNLIWWMIAIFFFILFSGGLNSSNYAGYACNAFPFCNSDSAFSFFWDKQQSSLIFNSLQKFKFASNYLEFIHLAHRIITILGSLFLIYFIILYWLKRNLQWKILGYSIICLLFCELGVGIINALFSVPVFISILHTTLASSIVGILAWSLSLARYQN